MILHFHFLNWLIYLQIDICMPMIVLNHVYIMYVYHKKRCLTLDVLGWGITLPFIKSKNMIVDERKV